MWDLIEEQKEAMAKKDCKNCVFYTEDFNGRKTCWKMNSRRSIIKKCKKEDK